MSARDAVPPRAAQRGCDATPRHASGMGGTTHGLRLFLELGLAALGDALAVCIRQADAHGQRVRVLARPQESIRVARALDCLASIDLRVRWSAALDGGAGRARGEE